MSTRVIIDLPDHIFRRVESIARQSRRAVDEVVVDVVARSVRSFPVAPDREAMLREIAAYRAMHDALRRDHLGKYVAIYQGELVDSDIDAVALLGRIRRDYPGKTVLRRKVEDTPEVILRFRSPRLSPHS
jgi:hypothetical protein